MIKCFFSLSSLVLSNAWSSYLQISVNITFVSAIVFKLGALSDLMHFKYMMWFSTIYCHGLIEVYNQNVSVVQRIGSCGLNHVESCGLNNCWNLEWNLKMLRNRWHLLDFCGYVAWPISLLSLAKPAVSYQTFRWSACLSAEVTWWAPGSR